MGNRSPAGHCRGMPEHSCAFPHAMARHIFLPSESIPACLVQKTHDVKFTRMRSNPILVTHPYLSRVVKTGLKTRVDINSHKGNYKDDNQSDLVSLRGGLSSPTEKKSPELQEGCLSGSWELWCLVKSLMHRGS